MGNQFRVRHKSRTINTQPTHELVGILHALFDEVQVKLPTPFKGDIRIVSLQLLSDGIFRGVYKAIMLLLII